MPYTIAEALATLPEAMAFFNKLQAEIAKLPKAPAPVSATAYSSLVAAVIPDLGSLIDRVRADVAS